MQVDKVTITNRAIDYIIDGTIIEGTDFSTGIINREYAVNLDGSLFSYVEPNKVLFCRGTIYIKRVSYEQANLLRNIVGSINLSHNNPDLDLGNGQGEGFNFGILENEGSLIQLDYNGECNVTLTYYFRRP